MDSIAVQHGQEWLEQARQLRRMRQWIAAAEAYQQALEIGVGGVEDYLALGATYEELGNWRQAEAAYRHVLISDAQSRKAYECLIRVLEQTGRASQARVYARALANLRYAASGQAKPEPAIVKLHSLPEKRHHLAGVPYGTMALLLLQAVVLIATVLIIRLAPVQAGNEQRGWMVALLQFFDMNGMSVLLNGIALCTFGPHAERLFGRSTYLALCLLSGLYAVLTTMALDGYLLPISLSGMVLGMTAGLAGALVQLRQKSSWLIRDYRILLWTIVGYCLIYFLTSPGSGHLGNIAGAMTGLILGWLLVPRHLAVDGTRLLNRDRPFTQLRLLSMLGAAALLPVVTVGLESVRPLVEAADWTNYSGLFQALDERECQGVIDHASEILTHNPNDEIALSSRAYCNQQMGRVQEAVADLARAEQADPANDGIYDSLVRATLQAAVDSPAEAAVWLDQAWHHADACVSHLPQSARCYILRTMVDVRRVKDGLGVLGGTTAIEDADRAIHLDNALADAYYWRAWAYLQAGRYDLALVDAGQARVLDPGLDFGSLDAALQER